MNNTDNSSSGNSIKPSYGAKRGSPDGIGEPYFPNLLSGQRTVESLSVQGVSFVVSRGARVEMIGVYARRIIASVKNQQARRNVGMAHLIRTAVRRLTDALVVSPMRDKAITVCPIQPACPNPARAKFGAHSRPVLINEFPETNCEWYFRSTHDLSLRDRLGLWSGSLENSNSLAGRFVF